MFKEIDCRFIGGGGGGGGGDREGIPYNILAPRLWGFRLILESKCYFLEDLVVLVLLRKFLKNIQC